MICGAPVEARMHFFKNRSFFDKSVSLNVVFSSLFVLVSILEPFWLQKAIQI